MATDRIIAEYEIDLKKLTAQVREIQNQYKKTEDSAKKAASSASQSFGNAFGGLDSQIRAIGSGILAAFSVNAIINYSKQAIKAFADSEDAAARLRFTITNITGGSEKTIEGLVKQAKALEQATFFDADDIIRAQSMQAQFGLTEKQIKILTDRLPDLAVALNTDLAGANDIALRALEGQTRGLKILGADFKDTGTAAGNFNALIDKTAKVAGTAANALNNMAGEIRNADKDAENLSEEIGEKLTPYFINLRNGALRAAAALLELFDSKTTSERVRNEVQALTDKLAQVNTSRPLDALFADREILNLQNQKIEKRLEELEVIKAGKFFLQGSFTEAKEEAAQLLAERSILLAKEQAITAELKRRQDVMRETLTITDLEGAQKQDILNLTRKQLEEEIKILSASKDPDKRAIEDEIKRREAQLKKLSDAEKKATEESIKEQKAAREKFFSDTKTLHQKTLEELIDSESEKLKIQKQFALETAKLNFIKAGGRVSDDGTATGDIDLVRAFNQQKADIEIGFGKLITTAQINEAETRKKNESDAIDDLTEIKGKKIDQQVSEEKTERLKAFTELGDFSKEAETKLQQDLLQIDSEGLQKRIDVQKKIIADVDSFTGPLSEGQAEAKEKANEELTKLNLEYADSEKNITLSRTKSIEEIEKESAEKRKKILQGIVDAARDIGNSLFEFSSNQIQRDIEALENAQNVRAEGFDKEQEDLQRKLDKELITRTQFETASAKVKDKRAQSEADINKKVNELKKKQDLATRAQSVFEITISAAVAFAAHLKESPVVAALIAAAAIAQLAVVLGTPLPQYTKGTLKVPGRVKGKDSVHALLEPDEAVIPVAQNKEYHPTVKAVFNREIPSEVLNRFVTNYKTVNKENYSQETIADKADKHSGKADKDSGKLIPVPVDQSHEYYQTIKAIVHRTVESGVLNSFVEKYKAQSEKTSPVRIIHSLKPEVTQDVVQKVVELQKEKGQQISESFAEKVLTSIGFTVVKSTEKTVSQKSIINKSSKENASRETKEESFLTDQKKTSKLVTEKLSTDISTDVEKISTNIYEINKQSDNLKTQTFSDIIRNNNGTFLKNNELHSSIRNFTEIKSMLPAVNFAKQQQVLVEQKIRADMQINYDRLENGIAEKLARKLDYIQAKYDTKKVVRVENLGDLSDMFTESPSDKLRKR